jgi:electron transport complex protein RnfA
MSGGVKLILIVVSAVFVNNYVLSQFLGICPFLGVSKKVDTAIGMGLAVVFVMALASAVTYLIQYAILDKFNLGYLQTIVFILVIAALVQFVEMFLQKASPTLYQSLGVYLPLITTNCAVLGVAITNIDRGYNLIETIFNGVGGALGFTLAIVIFAGVRERLELSDIPECLRGFPIAMISAGLMALSFLGFQGLIKL